MNAVAIIQARMTSTRLPGKVMADLAGKPLLRRMLDRVTRAQRVASVVIATTVNAADDPVVCCAVDAGIKVFRGDEADVLGRMHGAAQLLRADPIVRLTADCPMSDPGVIDAAIDLFEHSKADYVSNCNRRTFPDGLDVEVFSARALEIADQNAKHPQLREHVTPYIRGSRPDLGCGDFRRADLLAQADFGHLRFTIDTAEDLAFVGGLFARLPEEFSWLDAVALATRDPAALRVTLPATNLAGIAVRKVTLDDAPTLFRWLNEDDRRAVSLGTAVPVAWTDHLAWLQRKLSDSEFWMAIATHDGISAGVVRLDREADGLYVSVYVDRAFRGRNVGQAMIAEARKAADHYFAGSLILARVRADNRASQSFFTKLGFASARRESGFAVLIDGKQS